MIKVLHLEHERYSPEALKKLSGRCEVDFFSCPTQEALYDRLYLAKYHAIFTRIGVTLDEKCISSQDSLQYIVTPTTGLNHIDLEVAGRRNVKVVSLKGETEFLASIKSTAEHVWALLLTLTRRTHAAHENVISGAWVRAPFLCDELDGKKLGIIGYGRLGKIVARYGIAFGMEVLVNDKVKIDDNIVKVVEVNELLRESDFVMLLVSWSKENEHLMNESYFSMMKIGAYFINVSRGELVDENALLNALKIGRLKGAGLDVLNNDSAWSSRVEGSSDLIEYARKNNNLIITPHIGGYGKDSILRTRDFITEKFLKYTGT